VLDLIKEEYMNKNCILIICLSFWVVFAAYSQQYYDDENDFIYENIWDHHERGSRMLLELEITGYVGRKNNVRIPPRIQGLPVKGIGYRAFIEKQLTGIKIPNGIDIWII
jgi:hypothetical protein